jgi:hypothetical protein
LYSESLAQIVNLEYGWREFSSLSIIFPAMLTRFRLTGGYWDSVCPESPLVKRYKMREYSVSRDRLPESIIPNEPFTVLYIPDGKATWYLPPPETSFQFWFDWFTYLKSQGVDFLKVDNQGSLIALDGIDGSECRTALWKNLVLASDQVFGKGRVIHCMSQHEAMVGGPQGFGLMTDHQKVIWR